MNPTACNVLVVDDEAVIRELVVRWLTKQGYRCAEAADAQQAWNHLLANETHLVILDIHMPGESGMELLPRIHERFPDTAVIMQTAVQETRTAIEALTQAAWGYVLKPVDREEILFQVARSLERREMLLERRQYTERLEAKVREQTRTIRQAHEETILALVEASSYRDEETGAHIRRIGLFSEALATAAGWSPSRADDLRLAALMHDIGKIGIPDVVLRKEGELDAREREVMRRHAELGERMLAGFQTPLLQLARAIILCHHERWDGFGYPGGLAGVEIPEGARIVSIVDVYDALTHDRVYRAALPEHLALEIMVDGRGSHFDPRLFDVFLDTLPELRAIAARLPDRAAATPSPLEIGKISNRA